MIVLANEKYSSTVTICLNCLPVCTKKLQVAGQDTR